MKYRGRLDVWPLAILSGILFVALSLAIVPQEDGLPMLVYLPVVSFVALILYMKGIKPIDSDFPPSLFGLAFVSKLIASLLFYWLMVEVYGRGDANTYHREAQYVAQYLRQFDLSILGSYTLGRQGTTNVVYLTGLLYTFLLPGRQAGGLFFATLAFAGSVFFYRAFRLAFPDASPRLYLLIIFFLPSILFWTSMVGKDAWGFFGSGFVAYGLVKYAREARWSGLFLAILGLFMVYLVRPHIAAFMIVAAAIAFLLFYRVDSPRRLLGWLLGGGVIIVVALFLLPSAGEFLGLGPISEATFEEVESEYEFRQLVSYRGGSGFLPQTVFSVQGFISAPIVVLLRPFPWEAHNQQAMLTSLESLVWLGLFWTRRRVLWTRLRSIRRDPWIAFALGYSVIMILALTTAGNFGIIARQRVAFLPFLWVLFA
jgi:hypothetical protein